MPEDDPGIQHTDPNVTIAQKGPTGTFLSNVYAGTPPDLPMHPTYIDRYLTTSFPTTDHYAPYREGMIGLIHYRRRRRTARPASSSKPWALALKCELPSLHPHPEPPVGVSATA